MKGIFLIIFYSDDVMMIHCCVQRMTSLRLNKVYKRRHHGGLQDFSEDDDALKIDMNLFKSIWGLMLGILLLGINRPTWAGLTSLVV